MSQFGEKRTTGRVGTSVKNTSQSYYIDQTDEAGNILRAHGTTLPAAGNFAVGAQFIDTDQTAGIGGVYQNVGTTSTPVWVRMDNTRMAEVSISIAEMLALRATPKTLVAAPGAGKVLEFLGALLIYDYAAAYTEDADNLAVKYTNGSGAIVSTTLETTGLLDATADQIRTFKPIVTDLTPVANAALVLHNTGGEEFGGTGSPLRMKVFYRVTETGL